MEIDKITLEREFLDKLLSLNYLNESDWAELESLVNLLQNDFTCKVRQNFPMLSRDDIHIILLMHIGMKNIEIAKLLFYLHNSKPDSYKKNSGNNNSRNPI